MLNVLKPVLKSISELASLAERYGSRGLGLTLYNAGKGAAKALNQGKPTHFLADLTRARLEWLFPTVELSRVAVIQAANLPANWFVQPNSVEAMTFGWEIYVKSSDGLETSFEGLLLLMHELVHVRQIRDLGEGEFARRYGEQWEAHGGYPSLPLEEEAYGFVVSFQMIFDPAFYLNTWPDVNAAVGGDHGGALAHWLYFGVNEGRQSSGSFSVAAYLAKNPDLQAAGFDNQAAVRHWLEYGHAEGRVAT